MNASAQLGNGTGWGAWPVTFKVQTPTNAPENERYWYTNGVYHCEIFHEDGAFAAGNKTCPRSEQRFLPDYTSGEIQYQAMEMAPSNENSYCIFQIHTGGEQTSEYGSTQFMLFWFSDDGGSVYDYSKHELASHLGNKWFQVNVDHDVDHHTIRVWINRQLVWTQKCRDADDFYFKDGVYEQPHNPSRQMDAYITGIHIWTRSNTITPRLASTRD